jgi:hypothetical protein
MTDTKKKKEHPLDPFKGMEFVGVFGLGVARYAYDYMDKPEKTKKKTSKDELDGLV